MPNEREPAARHAAEGNPVPKRTRKQRSDRKPAAQRYAFRMTVKLTAHGRKELTRQRRAAKFKGSDSDYVRSCLTAARAQMELSPLVY